MDASPIDQQHLDDVVGSMVLTLYNHQLRFWFEGGFYGKGLRERCFSIYVLYPPQRLTSM